MNTIIQSILQPQRQNLAVASLQDAIRTRTQLVHDVSVMLQRIQQHPNLQWALWQDSSYDFCVNFFALLLAQKTVVLPPNRIAATEAMLAEHGIVFWDGTTADQDMATWQAQPWPNLDDNAAHIVFFTSGSTGAPKRIPRTLAQLSVEISVLAKLFPWQAQVHIWATVSHQHLYGLCYKILLPILQDCIMVDAQCQYPEDVALLPHTQQPHILISSPAFLSRWQEPKAAAQFAHIFSSGGPLPSTTAAELQHSIIEIFGSSETGGIAWREAAQAWQVFPNATIKIDEQEQLWVRSAHACSPDWLTTGDRAAMSATDSGFELKGRMDRMVKLEEKRLSLDAIETVLQAHPDVSDAHVLLWEQGHKHQLAAVISLNDAAFTSLKQLGKLAFLRQLKRDLASQLESIALPKRWRIVPSLGRNSQSKLNRHAMLQLFEPQLRPVHQIVFQQDTQAQLSLWFAPELLCFKGHFPTLPIYPGVAQLDCVQHLARLTLFPQHVCVGMEQLKFQQPIRPFDQVMLTLERKGDKAHFKLNRGDTILASGRLCFQDACA